LTSIDTVQGEDVIATGSADDDYADVDGLFAYRDNADTDDDRLYWRQQIVTKAMPLADHIASRFAGRGVAQDDLLQVARLALTRAVDRYDRAKGRFVSFAVPTILGELRKYFRDNTWGMHVPRRYQEASLAMSGAVADMSQRLGRTPTTPEIAAELNLSPEEFARAQVAHQAYRPLSLDATIPTSEAGMPTRASLHGTVDAGYTKLEDLIVLADLVRDLTARERAILRMRFYDCLKQSEIAARLGVSQVHVSRMLTATLKQLRTRMCSDIAAVLVLLLAVALHC
jgi:RNA polymerase sigma-B factor